MAGGLGPAVMPACVVVRMRAVVCVPGPLGPAVPLRRDSTCVAAVRRGLGRSWWIGAWRWIGSIPLPHAKCERNGSTRLLAIEATIQLCLSAKGERPLPPPVPGAAVTLATSLVRARRLSSKRGTREPESLAVDEIRAWLSQSCC